MMIFDREGNFLKSWGEGLFTCPHNVRIGPDGSVYCVDRDDHTVRKLTFEGEVLLTLGSKDKPSDTGCINRDHRTIKRVSGPFNGPTDVAFSPSGELYVSDGYGNARVHKFSKDGKLLFSWGELGDGPGQFRLPHSVYVDRQGRVYVADRENSRIQIFTSDGEFITQWTDVNRPTDIFIDDEAVYVSELGYMVGQRLAMSIPTDREKLSRVSILSPNGEALARWCGEDRCAPGNFFAAHSICVDSRGDIYVGELTVTSSAPSGCHALQKFARKRS